MTHAIVQSDIDLAKRLLSAGQSNEEIIVALVCRRIEPEQARQLVADLRIGKKVEPQLDFGPEGLMTPEPALRSAAIPRQSQSVPGASRSSGTRQPSRVQTRSRNREPARRWTMPFLVCCILVLGGGSLLAYRQLKLRRISNATAANPSNLPNGFERQGPERNPRFDSRSVSLEIGSTGLLVEGNAVNHRNALAALGQLLGPATRTNQVDQPRQIIYAFDRHGLLIYSQTNGEADSIMLDCAGLGGSRGTQSPFSGSLKIEKDVIRSETDSKTLAAISSLQFTQPADSGGIFRTVYKEIGLCFAYLKNDQRVSLIEIDLR